ncbi:endochitinase [Coprinopsis cinerea okayama7|uniref:Endochitinase n=1 Tax=Coprinopsis cinerea (strain Okayama-7 / 130 / ATCC MYA-4618 / FGSC 9003) TaxID=240176 RepID=A8N7A9_COPC7|nr:endochitinase [Coprinopsis cinerea okayama7\|eukprot:XP_001830715.2 endochitinase [Coprinopsis cinerea okayama7\
MLTFAQLPLVLLSLTLSVVAVHDEQLVRRAPTDDLIVAAWYTGWHSRDFPLSRVSWSKYTHMTYAFGITTPSPDVLALDESDERLLPEFVDMAHRHATVGSASNRTTFVNTLLDVVRRYNLDGLDFDWEYPNMQGLGCNIVHEDDTANFLTFLRELRNTTTGRDLVLSAAVYVKPFNDASGSPSTDVSGFAEVLDYIAVMNYDVPVNPSVGAGSRSPLDDTCAPAGAKWGSAVSSIEEWTKAGIPLEKLVLGVPAHGHSYDVSPVVALSRSNSSQLNAYPSYSPADRKRGDRWDGEGGMDVCGVTWGPGGVYTYWGLFEGGFLNADGSVAEGIVSRYDDCSETPFVYNPETQVYVSYENPRSYAAKGDFIYSTGLGGFAMWEAGGDRNDTLLDSIIHASLNGNPSARTAKSKVDTQAVVPTPGSRETTANDLSGASPSVWNATPNHILGSALAFIFNLLLSSAW